MTSYSIIAYGLQRLGDIEIWRRRNPSYGDPHHYSKGMVHVLVNGVPVILDEKFTGERPGELAITLKTQRRRWQVGLIDSLFRCSDVIYEGLFLFNFMILL
ncbi:MAG: hypothetical protein PWR06_994 [Thermoanaerobacteraceae bacterium]|nr:hypothetical protein [Thermoanaerobacteraceae bacterium]